MPTPAPDSNPYYPDLLRRAEDELIKLRRDKVAELDKLRRDQAKPKRPVTRRHGLAFSGGGIRSATFNLGILQALARAEVLRNFDFLSTVSGGGYVGSFFGAWVARPGKTIASVEGELGAAMESREVRFLRENGRYLAPNGTGDAWAAASAVLRSWVALLAVMGLFAFAFFAIAVWAREALFPILPEVTIAIRGFEIHFSPLLMLALGVTAVAVVPLGVAFWALGERPWRMSWLFVALVVLAAGAAWLQATCRIFSAIVPNSDRAFLVLVVIVGLALIVGVVSWVWANFRSQSAASDSGAQSNAAAHGNVDAGRRVLTDWLASALALVAVFAITGLADTVATSWLLATGNKKLAALHAVLGAAVVAGKFLWSHLTSLTEKKSRPAVPLTVVAGIAAGAIALALYTLLDLWALKIARQLGAQFLWDIWGVDSAVWCLGGVALIALLVCWLAGRSITFLNLSSHQALYSARITRAYLGASNAKRQDSVDQDITDPVPDDQIVWPDYRPHLHGGPLHLINVTVNETVSGKSQIEQRDRHGFALAIGPAAVSAGRVHHALLFPPLLDPERADATHPPQPTESSRWNRLWLDVFPLPLTPGQFPLLGVGVAPKKAPPTRPLAEADAPPREQLNPRNVQALPVGGWVGVSGAAFSTGLGARTSIGLSFLAGLFNVRLGYWWDSGVNPSERSKVRTPPNLGSRVGDALAWLFPVQTYLTDEILARFHGPSRRRWYLTDGGHFENTAAYELIRRRVPVIVVCDCGADDTYTFDDLGNLVRLVRTDFCAEIRFLGAKRLGDLALSENARSVIGPLDELKLQGEADATEPKPRYVTKHAALAEVIYPGETKPGSVLLWIKPGVSGDEPADVLNYHAANPAFPQQPTSDQFFDAAQWESYRRVGQVIGDALFAADGDALDLEKILETLRA